MTSVSSRCAAVAVLISLASGFVGFGCAAKRGAGGAGLTTAAYFDYRQGQQLANGRVADRKIDRTHWRFKGHLVVQIKGDSYTLPDGSQKQSDYAAYVDSRKDLPPTAKAAPTTGRSPGGAAALAEEDESSGITLVHTFPFIVLSDGISFITGQAPAGSSGHVVAGADGTTFIIRVRIFNDGTELHQVYVPSTTEVPGNGDVHAYATYGNVNEPAQTVHPGEVFNVPVTASGLGTYTVTTMTTTDTDFVVAAQAAAANAGVN